MAKRSKQQLIKDQRQRTTAGADSQTVAKSKSQWAWQVLAIAVLLSSAGVIAGGAWLSIQLFFNPDEITWINDILPEWAQIPVASSQPPQTVAQIRAKIINAGQIPGEVAFLEIDPETSQAKSLLLPVSARLENCQSNCDSVVELRVYQLAANYTRQRSKEGEIYYQLVSQVAVEGLENSFVIAPLVEAAAANPGDSDALPISQLHRFEGATPDNGFWLYLRGDTVQAGEAIAYGYIVHYNPSRSHLSLMLPWTSPAGQPPQWQQVTGGGFLELVVDQTVDLEPQLSVYQIKPLDFYLNPIQLQPISLAEPALKDSAFRDAIALAKSGLWTPSYKWLEFIKKQQKGRMAAPAQAQIDLIKLYSQLTKTQADTTWANSSQEVLADIIDGRWGEALQVFQASPENTKEIATLLEADTGRLWKRVEAALRVNPNRAEVKAWGALILASSQGREKAIAWLNEQPQTTPKTIAYIQPLLNRLFGDSTKTNSTGTSRIVGSVKAIASPNPKDWLQPNPTSFKAEEQQSWYQVELTAFNDGNGWQQAPFADLKLPKKGNIATFLWEKLGLNSDPLLQIVVWLPDGQQETNLASVKAVQLKNGVLRLLATSEKIASVSDRQALALTQAALQWVQPQPISVTQLNEQQPTAVKAILPILWQELRKSGQLKKGAVPSFDKMREKLGEWPVQTVDLTGDNKAEVVMSIAPEAIASLNNVDLQSNFPSTPSQPHTLIFSESGKVLHSEFGTAKRTIRAIADLEDGLPPALLIEDSAKTYRLQRWNAQNQRFQ